MEAKIVIIGAGVSGLAAISKLSEAGYKNIIVLEAENRIGGRIYPIRFDEDAIDFEANWFYDISCKLAEFRQSDGTIVDKTQVNKLIKLIESIVRDVIKKPSEFFTNYIVQRYNEVLAGDKQYSDVNLIIAKEVIDYYQKFFNVFRSKWFDVSTESESNIKNYQHDHLLNWKERGYKTISDILMKNYAAPSKAFGIESKILLNKRVNQIMWNCDSNNLEKIKCFDGSAYDADHIIFTGSFGVLKENYLSLFKPELPELKVNAIKNLSFQTVSTINIEFVLPFWPKEWLGCNLLWTEKDFNDIQDSKYVWLTGVIGFNTISNQPNSVQALIFGKSANEMETQTEEDIKDAMLFLLRKYLPNWTIPSSVQVSHTKWTTNPNFQGSQTLVSDGISNKDVAAPICNTFGAPVLQFAGETIASQYFPSSNGAFESGWREAQRIIDFYDIYSSKNQEIYDILILGSGISGLGAGYALTNFNTGNLNQKIKFKILEGANRPGGRIFTTKLKSVNPEIETNSNNSDDDSSDNIEGGAQWMHAENNLLHELSEKNQFFSGRSVEGEMPHIRYHDLYTFSDDFITKIETEVERILGEAAEYRSKPEFPESVGSFLEARFNKYTDEHLKDDEIEKAKQLFDWHTRLQIIDNSCLSLNQLSCKYWGDYNYGDEETKQDRINYNQKGFSQIVYHLENHINKENIIYNKEIIEIKYFGSCFYVKCQDNSIYKSKSIILTFSIGVLKSFQVNIHETLQKPLSHHFNVIGDHGFDSIGKIFLKFENSWWEDLKGFQFIWKDTESYKTENWTRHLLGFDVLTRGAENTLLGWIGGEGYIELEKQTDIEIINMCVKILKHFTQRDVPMPIKYYISRWKSDKFIRGSYSYPSTAFDKSKRHRDDLSVPILLKNIDENINDVDEGNRPAFLFAGEACHAKYFSTTHGAFLSGIDQATKIIEFLGKMTILGASI